MYVPDFEVAQMATDGVLTTVLDQWARRPGSTSTIPAAGMCRRACGSSWSWCRI